METGELFKNLLELPEKHLQLLAERIEETKREIELHRGCLDASWALPDIKHEDILQAREYLIKGDSVGAITALILYINKTSK
jgi:hypothetical protein